MKVELIALDVASTEAEWLCELLLDFTMVVEPILVILMNCDNQMVIVKERSTKDNVKSTRHVKKHLKSIRKLRNSGI